MGPDEAVIVFHNVAEHSWPDNLNYSIRMKNQFMTDGPLSDGEEYNVIPLPHKQYGTIYKSFMRLQWAVDTSFIEMMTGNVVKQRMSVQEFPYVSYSSIEDKGATHSLKSDLLFFAADLAILPGFYTLMLRTLTEKANGVQELMKMTGVTPYDLATSHVLNALVPGLIYSLASTVLMKMEPSALLMKSHSFLIFLAMFLQSLFTITAAMVSSYLARQAPPTGLTVSAVYILLTLPAYIVSNLDLSKYMVYPCGLIPFMPLSWIFKEACKLEAMGTGLTLTTMMKSHTDMSGPALMAYIVFVIHIILCVALFWYLDLVIPGYYGSTHPWNFLWQKEYWSKTASDPNIGTEKIEKPLAQVQDPQYFEEPPKHLEAGIKVINVTKEYPKHRALDNVSLEIFKGEITILLGHNGAGKSTLMSVITGMTGATKGKVLVNGFDMMSHKAAARQQMGLCPQQNMFLESLSVIEHVMFFTLLNGGTFEEARKSSKILLDQLHIKDKAKNKTSQLSGGMQRRVQLACALAGQASVLLLDEPTSGLDVETRRSLWDLLLSLRGTRTVLLSTHFMEEADALGDRVAALHAGQLRCHATPMHLKRAIGTGYRLTFTTTGLPNEPAITSAVKSVVSEATVKESGFNSISYNLPSANSKNFPSLFSTLESQKTELRIESIGVGTSTLEEVFLKLCSNVETGPIAEDEIKGRKAPKYKKLKGIPLYFRQMMALIKRYLRFLWIYKITQIGFGIIRVVILILVITGITNDSKHPKKDKTFLAMNLDMYRPSSDYRILYKIDGNDSDLRPLSDQYPRVHFESASDVDEALLRSSQQDKMEYNNYLAGIELNETDAKVMYTTTVRHAAPSALNVLSNLVATRALPWAGGRTITTYNHPLAGAYTPYSFTEIKEPKSITNINLWMFSTTLMLLSGIIFMIQLPCKEAAGARHIHALAGCSPELHWAALLLACALQVLLTYVVTLIVACTFLDFDKTFSDMEFMIAASVVVLLGSMAMLSFSYQITIYFSQGLAVGLIAITMVFFVLIFPILLGLVPSTRVFEPTAVIVMPPYTFNQAMEGCTMTAYLNALCKLNKDKCPTLVMAIPYFDADKCCKSVDSNPWCYFCFQDVAPGKNIIYLTVQIFLYMTVVILSQRGMFCVIWEKTVNYTYKPAAPRYNDRMVKAEQEYVKKTIKLPPQYIPDLMLVSKVHKNYRGLTSSFTAVKGVSFSVKRGECFGLLGVNGAGKSTMFRMLTADMCPTKGRIFTNGHELTFPYSSKYLYSLGYCPQFWGLDDFLTGRQNLDLLLALHGLNERDTNAETKAWIKLVGLEKYTDQLVSGYSGGCLRRLAAACALCTGAPLTLLDEPTAGVDVAARRRVWYALKRSLRDQHAIIITSHSLDEMEALCHRISIMAAGEICALGSPAGLRAAFASGHSVYLKIKYEPGASSMRHRRSRRKGSKTVTIAPNPKAYRLKAAIEKKFKCTLKDEHKTMLHYHINETMEYSKLFQEMEDLKTTFSELIEDYTVSETTLEEVFLSFAKPQNGPAGKSKSGTKPKGILKDVSAGPA
ncbi:phospholipid-transporting ATPase ABCA1-like [Ostrinia nubilalis]|uniref:phospholipid-transporting ATPase ABCA1-like n=1 Tax=Ostrinia nubilalis TaxID=29057 RepID=UPI00308254D8